MKTWIIIIFLSLGFTLNAQEVISDGKLYMVKGKAIFQNGNDITSTLLNHERDKIYKTLKVQTKKVKDAEKARNYLEKAAKKSEKAKKSAEKALKQRKKAENNFNKASYKLKQQQEKYDKLKNKGKLSPKDEAKWLKKLQGYKKTKEKAKHKLQKL